MVKRGKSRFIYCKKHPKHKQRQGFHTLAMSEFEGGDSAIDSLQSLFRATGLAASPSNGMGMGMGNMEMDMSSIAKEGVAGAIMLSTLKRF